MSRADPLLCAVKKTKGGQVTTYVYNARNRLEKVYLPDGRVTTYSYDPFGRRLRKQVGNDITFFAYADEGLVGEYDASGAVTKTYGWRPDGLWGTDPVYMAEGENTYFYHNDHLGTPQKLTSAADGAVEWSAATYASFGYAQVDQASTVTNNLRFPGQYFDAETGLHYNQQRYYDPVTGKYTQVDPIGFSGGDVNLYSYTQNGPLVSIDSSGLDIEILVGGPYSSHSYGHVALRVYGDGYDYVYDFGRYGKTWGVGGGEGEGQLRVWSKFDKYVNGENATGRTTYGYVYETTTEQDKNIMEYYANLIGGVSSNKAYGDYMKQYKIDDYHGANNNCTTKSLDGVSSGVPGGNINSEKYDQGRGLTFIEKLAYRSAKKGKGIRMPLDLKESIENDNKYKKRNEYHK